ncbi:hypothetical protein KP509_15G078000 [Ceratopteris richardii]|uniref:RNA polymerase sigma-70 region 2 domain-containing protein n=1 Tax=Ceratopteris richardii TaxID=49495 RepID=A0A8T2T519_CERRI|nr:hypothetical protein KP509_15G078000 [Ceratopteris richardii]
MAGSSVTSLRNCSAYPDSSQFYLQLIAPPEASASCLHYSSPSTKNLRSRISVVVSAVKHPLCNSFDAEDVLHCRCKPLWGGFGIKTASPSDCCQVSPMVQAWQCSCKKKTQRRTVVLSGAANSMLDHCSNDTGDFASPSVSYWTEEVLASLRRSLLESQWTLEPADSLLFEDESSSLESCNANKTWEQLNSHLNTQRLGSAVVRSGKASARHRRLASRSRPDSMSQQNIHDGHDNSKDHDFVIPTKFLAKKRRNKVKLDAMQGFLASFLKQSSGCGIHTKEQEKCYTKQFRIFQNLQKARNELKQKLGYDPPYELWARSVNMSVEELRSMVKEGEIARDKLISSHVRLVVSVAKAYRNLGVDISDLVLEGSKGLLRGLEKFDHRKGYKMSTYVHWWIRQLQGMTRAIADHSRLVRVPVYLHEIMFAIKRAKETLDRRGKPMTVEVSSCT